MKTVYQIAKDNKSYPVIIYKRIRARGIKPRIIKGVMYLDECQEKQVLTYAKRGRKSAEDYKNNTRR